MSYVECPPCCRLLVATRITKSECMRFVHTLPGMAQNLRLRVGARVPMSYTSI